MTPGRALQPPEDLEAGSETSCEADLRESDAAQKLRAGSQLERPQTPAPRVELIGGRRPERIVLLATSSSVLARAFEAGIIERIVMV